MISESKEFISWKMPLKNKLWDVIWLAPDINKKITFLWITNELILKSVDCFVKFLYLYTYMILI